MFQPSVFAVMVALLLPGVFPKQLQCTMEPDGSCSLIGSKVTADEILSTSFGSNPKVNTVQFSRSSLSAIPPALLQSFPDLEVLNGSASDIKQVFSRNFASGKKLRELYLRGNKIHELPEEAFFGPSRLRTLDLSSNSIASADGTVFKRLRELKTLLLGENELSEMHPLLFDDLTELESLHLQQNKLRAIGDRQFAGCTSLTHLNVSHNAIKTFHLPQFERRWLVDLIDASYNALTTVSIPSNLRQLVATGNSIRKVGRSGPDGIQAALILLKLPHNKLDSVDSLPTFEKLISLDLSYNQIRAFDFQSIAKFEKLILLKLDGNQLDTVSNSLAQPITNLKYVHLADNHFVQLDLDVLRKVPRVIKLDLRRNQLERLSVTDLSSSFPVMVRLMLEGNRLRCEDSRKLLKELKSSVTAYAMTREDCAKDQNLIDGICCS
uniref:Leucine rich immune protein (Coil-less) n=1 Tax=Anopheles atroparvus TaxID=41427 RepID=A0AAG5D5T5_ANOAO